MEPPSLQLASLQPGVHTQSPFPQPQGTCRVPVTRPPGPTSRSNFPGYPIQIFRSRSRWDLGVGRRSRMKGPFVPGSNLVVLLKECSLVVNRSRVLSSWASLIESNHTIHFCSKSMHARIQCLSLILTEILEHVKMSTYLV